MNPTADKTAAQYARRLARMIACPTVSKEPHRTESPFVKLREEVKDLFPLLHEKARLRLFGSDAWLYELPGAGPGSLLLMSHHDVAEVDDEWTVDPFEGAVRDGKLYGRGAVDTKTPLFAEMQALEELLAGGFVPAVTVYLASSDNEEISGDGFPSIVAWFEENGIRPALVLDEGGAVIDPPLPGVKRKCAVLAMHEKGRHAYTLAARDDAGHAGLSPRKRPATVRVCDLVSRLSSKNPFERALPPAVAAMFKTLSADMPFPLRPVFGHPNLFGPLLARLMPKFGAQAAEMAGTTFTLRGIRGGKFGETPNRCGAEILLRSVDAGSFARDLARLEALAAKYGVFLERGDMQEDYVPSALGSAQYEFVRECVQAVFPQAAVSPFLLHAGTDARFITPLCDAVVRFAPIAITNAQLASVHGKDENIDLDALPPAVTFYKTVLLRMH